MTDRELAAQVIQGHQQAFAEIVHRYSGMVFSKALGVMRTEEGAAEVTQQTFIRAYESLAAWRGTELTPWLAAIATHTALKLLDKERRRRTTSLDELPPGTLDAAGRVLASYPSGRVLGGFPSGRVLGGFPSGRVLGGFPAESSYSEEHEARLQQMEAAIATLPEADQQLLHLHYYERCSTADIAHRTGLSQSNVLVKLHRIRERLKNILTSSPLPRRGE